MSADSAKAYTLLQNSLVQFFDELIEMFPKQGDFVAFRIMVKDRIPVTEVVSHFKKTLLPEKDKIKAKTVPSFQFNGDRASISLSQIMNNLFTSIGVSANTFSGILNNLDKDTEDAMWKWLNVFVTLTEKCN
jgi:hypothetical protein